MRTAIIAGGKGTRIGGFFPDLPKPMIPISGKPLLQWQIESLVAQGICDVTFIIGHMADQIQAHFGDGATFGAKISYVVEDELLGTGGALVLLPPEDTLLLYGDIYCEVDFSRFISFHNEKKGDITLFAHPNSHPHDSDIIVTDQESRVMAWKSKNDCHRGDLRNLVNAGLYVFSSGALPKGPATKRDLERDVTAPMLQGGKMFAYRSTEYVKDMGTPERLAEVENDIKSGMAASRNLKNRQRAVFLDRDGTINKLRGLIDSPDSIELLPRAAEAIRLLNKSPFLAICVTNQPIIARGMASHEQLDMIHARLDTLLGKEGAYLDDLLFCPHHPDKGYPEENPDYKLDCQCRKPKPGLLLEASERYSIDLSRSYMIGDSTADILAGLSAGCTPIGIKTGEAMNDGKYADSIQSAYCTYDTLHGAVKAILEENLRLATE